MTDFTFLGELYSYFFMQYMHLYISAHKTHISATLTSGLLCVGYFFHLFFLLPSCYSLSPRWGWMLGNCWYCFTFVLPLLSLSSFALSLNTTCPVTWFIHSDRHRAGECCLSLPHISISLFLPLISAQGLFWGRNWKPSLVLMFISPSQALHCISIWECIRAPDFR